jgi:hypothetical protein
MSSPSGDAVKAEADAIKQNLEAVIAGTTPLTVVTVSGIVSTATAALNITGASNPGNADTLMQGQLVSGARVTTWTKTGFIQVQVTDSAGNITDGKHYIQIGTLS